MSQPINAYEEFVDGTMQHVAKGLMTEPSLRRTTTVDLLNEIRKYGGFDAGQKALLLRFVLGKEDDSYLQAGLAMLWSEGEVEEGLLAPDALYQADGTAGVKAGLLKALQAHRTRETKNAPNLLKLVVQLVQRLFEKPGFETSFETIMKEANLDNPSAQSGAPAILTRQTAVDLMEEFVNAADTNGPIQMESKKLTSLKEIFETLMNVLTDQSQVGVPQFLELFFGREDAVRRAEKQKKYECDQAINLIKEEAQDNIRIASEQAQAAVDAANQKTSDAIAKAAAAEQRAVDAEAAVLVARVSVAEIEEETQRLLQEAASAQKKAIAAAQASEKQARGSEKNARESLQRATDTFRASEEAAKAAKSDAEAAQLRAEAAQRDAEQANQQLQAAIRASNEARVASEAAKREVKEEKARAQQKTDDANASIARMKQQLDDAVDAMLKAQENERSSRVAQQNSAYHLKMITDQRDDLKRQLETIKAELADAIRRAEQAEGGNQDLAEQGRNFLEEVKEVKSQRETEEEEEVQRQAREMKELLDLRSALQWLDTHAMDVVLHRGLVGQRGPVCPHSTDASTTDSLLPYTCIIDKPYAAAMSILRRAGKMERESRQRKYGLVETKRAEQMEANSSDRFAMASAVAAVGNNVAIINTVDARETDDRLGVEKAHEVRWMPTGEAGKDMASASVLEHLIARCTKAQTEMKTNGLNHAPTHAVLAKTIVTSRLLQAPMLLRLQRHLADGDVDVAESAPMNPSLVTRPCAIQRGKVLYPHDGAGVVEAPVTLAMRDTADQTMNVDAHLKPLLAECRQKTIAMHRQERAQNVAPLTYVAVNATLTPFVPRPTAPTGALLTYDVAMDEINQLLASSDDAGVDALINQLENAIGTLNMLINCEEDYKDDPVVDFLKRQLANVHGKTSTASQKRKGLQEEFFRHLMISHDRLWVFVRTLSGFLGSDVNTVLTMADESAVKANKAFQEQKALIAKRVSDTQSKIVETVVANMMRESKLSLDKDVNGQMVVINSETRARLDELSKGDSGRPFYEV